MLVNYAQLPSAVTLVTTAETVAIVLPVDPTNAPYPQGRVVRGFLNILAGTGATAFVIRVRQGSTTAGALVGTADTVQVTAGNNLSVPYSQQDTGATPPANNVYCVTVQQTAATANGTVNDGNIEMEVPAPSGG